MVDIVLSFQNRTAIILELCDGSLQNFIKEREEIGFHEEEIVEIIESVAKSLNYVHSKGIVHRDLKPDNILFKEVGGIMSWKLADFGSSSKTEA